MAHVVSPAMIGICNFIGHPRFPLARFDSIGILLPLLLSHSYCHHHGSLPISSVTLAIPDATIAPYAIYATQPLLSASKTNTSNHVFVLLTTSVRLGCFYAFRPTVKARYTCSDYVLELDGLPVTSLPLFTGQPRCRSCPMRLLPLAMPFDGVAFLAIWITVRCLAASVSKRAATVRANIICSG
jgi:hypothetical protein